MKPATDAQKLFIYRVGKLADDKNRAVIEGVTKAFGLINDIDTTISEKDISKLEAFTYLESQRGDQEPRAFLESVTENVMSETKKEDFGTVRKALNEYRNFLFH